MRSEAEYNPSAFLTQLNKILYGDPTKPGGITYLLNDFNSRNRNPVKNASIIVNINGTKYLGITSVTLSGDNLAPTGELISTIKELANSKMAAEDISKWKEQPHKDDVNYNVIIAAPPPPPHPSQPAITNKMPVK